MAGYGGGGGRYPSTYGQFDTRSAGQEAFPFFVPGEGIKRQVIQTDLPRYLGNNALSKPGRNAQGIDGFWYCGYRQLTDAQIASLKLDSQKWTSERDLMSRRFPNHEIPGYERSATFRDSLQTNPDGSNPDHPYPSFPPPNPGPANPSFGGPYGAQAPNYHHTPAYQPPAPSGLGVPPTMGSNHGRLEWVNLPEGGKWYDHDLKQYLHNYPPPENVPATIPRPPPTEPQTGVPDEPEQPYRPNTGTEPTGYYGGPSTYYSRN